MFAENGPINAFIEKAEVEEVLEPDLPIIDAHHHLWDLRPPSSIDFEQKVYFCEEIMKDIGESGHHIRQTVFAQCGAFYRADGPAEMRVVGETEFVHGIAAMSRSGMYGETRLCTGIFAGPSAR